MSPVARIYYPESKKFTVIKCLRNSNLRHGPICKGWRQYSVEVYDERLITLLSLAASDEEFRIVWNKC